MDDSPTEFQCTHSISHDWLTPPQLQPGNLERVCFEAIMLPTLLNEVIIVRINFYHFLIDSTINVDMKT